ncbi:MAG: NlpC/P60 family protein [Ahrensia sp.]
MVSRLCDDARRAVLNEAQRWLGTPYRHQASRLGVGADCLGLIVGIWRTIYGTAPAIPADYAADWTIGADNDPLFDAAAAHCKQVPFDEARPGDLLTFRWTPCLPSRHLALLADKSTIIHAYERHGVLQSSLVPFWRRRVSGAFEFPPLPTD